MANKNRVTDKSTMHCYRIELPILIDDLDLSVYEFRLYVRFKRRAGDGGSCYEGTRSLAEACGMSMGQVSKAKKGLEHKGLIHIGTKQTRGGQTDEITICDLWPRNFKAYVNDESVHQVNTSPESVHLMNTSGEVFTPRSLSEESVHTVNTLPSKRSPGERKNHDQYHIESDSESPTPSMRENENGDGGGDDDFFIQLRKREVGAKRARQIADMPLDQSQILALIDNRPNASDPNSLGRLIIDICDGVAGQTIRPRAAPNGHAPPPPAPRAVLTASDRQRLAAQYGPFKKANNDDQS